MPGVFLSYRRDDVGLVAGDVAAALRAKIDATVFFDLQSIEAGADYQREIDAALSKCLVVVVLLGKDWFGRTSGEDRRIDDPEDIFRKEIETALRSGAYVIPVLVGIPSIDSNSLGAIQALANLQWHRIRLGQKDDDIDSLVERVQRALYERGQAELAGQKDGLIKIGKYSGPLSFLAPSRELTGDPFTDVLHYSEDLNFRINVAMISGRPLLIVGSERAGSSGIPFHVAKVLGRRLYIHSATARSTAQDFLFTFDDLRRLHDAQLGMEMPPDSYYIEPGILWWALDQESARRRGDSGEDKRAVEAIDPAKVNPHARDSVVLIESIHNLAPDDVNGLLTLLRHRSFLVQHTRLVVQASASMLTIFTARSLRNLDPRIRRNTVVYELPYPSIESLVGDALSLYPEDQHDLVEGVADALARTAEEAGVSPRIELGDFLAIVRAVAEMEIKPEGVAWRILLDSFGLLR